MTKICIIYEKSKPLRKAITMKLGLDSYSYHLAFGAHEDFNPSKKITLFDFIDKVTALGCDGFQIDPQHLASKEDSYIKEVLSYTKEKKIFLEYGSMGVEASYLSRELDYCSKFESDVLRTFVGFDRYDKTTDINLEIQQAIKNLNKIKAKAEDLNIKIAIENHGDVATDELIFIINEVNSSFIGICLDLGNPMMTLENPLKAAKKMAPYAFTTHFKDYAIQLTNYGFKVNGVALGDGHIDLPLALNILKEKTMLDKIILEIPVEAEKNETAAINKEDSYIRKSVEYAREVLKIM